MLDPMNRKQICWYKMPYINVILSTLLPGCMIWWIKINIASGFIHIQKRVTAVTWPLILWTDLEHHCVVIVKVLYWSFTSYMLGCSSAYCKQNQWWEYTFNIHILLLDSETFALKLWLQSHVSMSYQHILCIPWDFSQGFLWTEHINV